MVAKSVVRFSLPIHGFPEMKILRISLLCAGACSTVFSIVGLIGNFGDWGKLSSYAIIGAVIGLLVAPEFEPEVFRHPVLWQSFWGGVSALLIAVSLGSSIKVSIIATFAGTILGMTAKLWLKHTSLP